MDFGLILPSYRDGATTAGIDASTDAAARLGWDSVFTTDHILVEPSERSDDYFHVFDAVVTLAHVAARPAVAPGGCQRDRRAHAQRSGAGQGAGDHRRAEWRAADRRRGGGLVIERFDAEVLSAIR